jgi:alpha-L-arabinofuranosidase
MTTRRDFLRTGALVGGAVFLSRYGAFGSAQNARIEVLLDESIGTISPNIYGHFVEHLGGVVYDGVWVGEGSKISNTNGIRQELLEHLRRMKPGMIRWPGGCFADSYDWRDGIGQQERRARRTNFWAFGDKRKGNTAQKFDSNHFGTHEFIKLCRLAKAEPYFAANLRSLPARDFYQWIEYCNSPAGSTTLAEMRASNGSRGPFNVRYWGVGNEPWGCGGNFTADDYADEFRRFAAWVPGFDNDLQFIAAGPASGEWDWTRKFFSRLIEKGKDQLDRVQGWALHHYAWNTSRGRTENWDEGKGDALKFEEVDWYEILREGDKMNDLIVSHWKIMQELGAAPKTKLVVDEWGPWYRPTTEIGPGYVLSQMPTLRDAVFSAMTLDTFNRHADKVSIAATAQLVNCLNSPFLAMEDKFVATPVFHVFEMYAAHQGGQSVRTVISAPEVNYQRDGKPAQFWSLAGSASRKDKSVVLSLVNADAREPRIAEIMVRGGTVKSATMTSLADADIHAHNTFENPDTVEPVGASPGVAGGVVRAEIPARSVNVLWITMA